MPLFTLLPVEILEHILQFLNAEDIYSCNEAIELDVGDAFWKRICLRDGIVNREEEKEIEREKWREEYFAYFNWRKGNFDYRNIPCADQPVTIHKSNIFVPCGEKYAAYNIENGCTFSGKFSSVKVGVSGSYIAVVGGDVIEVYKYCKPMYRHFKTIIIKDRLVKISDDINKTDFAKKNDNLVTLNDRYLVVYQNKQKLLTMFNFINNSFTHIDIDCNFLFGLNVSQNAIYALLLKCNKYILNDYSLPSMTRNSVVISQNAVGILVPKVKYNEKLIISLITFFISSHSTLKIMNKTGDLLKTSQIDEKCTWFCLENNYVIYPTTRSVIQVWNYEKPEELTEIKVDEGFTTGNTAPSRVLIVVYEYYMEVFNYISNCKLYTIQFDLPKLTLMINRYYCVLVGPEFKSVSVLDFKKGKQKLDK